MIEPLRSPIRAKFANTGSNRTVRATICTGELATNGWRWNPSGVEFDEFLAVGGAVLYAHHPDRQVAWTSHIERRRDALIATAIFPPRGVSALADETYRQIKGRQLCGASPTLLPVESALIPGGQRGDRSILVEWSFAYRPADRACCVHTGLTERESRRFLEKAIGAVSPPREQIADTCGAIAATALREQEIMRRLGRWS
jgi:hypothetical protein